MAPGKRVFGRSGQACQGLSMPQKGLEFLLDERDRVGRSPVIGNLGQDAPAAAG